jgi:hypothetical protein
MVVTTLFDFGDNTMVLLRLTPLKIALLPYFYLANLITELSEIMHNVDPTRIGSWISFVYLRCCLPNIEFTGSCRRHIFFSY